MKEKGLLKDFWENFEEYLCSAALLVMTFVTFMNVFSRKITWFNMSFTQELVTTMFVWVCCLAAASVFKTDSHMGFNYLTDKFTGTKRKVYRICSSFYALPIMESGLYGGHRWFTGSITTICLQAFWRCLSGPSESPFLCQRFFPCPYGTV